MKVIFSWFPVLDGFTSNTSGAIEYLVITAIGKNLNTYVVFWSVVDWKRQRVFSLWSLFAPFDHQVFFRRDVFLGQGTVLDRSLVRLESRPSHQLTFHLT